MFILSFQARIDLQPDFNSVIGLAISQMLMSRRRLIPDWAPKDATIYLRSATSATGFVEVKTRLDWAIFKRNFYAAVRIQVVFSARTDTIPLQVVAFGSHFLKRMHSSASYLIVDHPELSPLWFGVLRSDVQSLGIPLAHAQELIRWDPQYGFPLLHNYIVTEGSIVVRDSTFFNIPRWTLFICSSNGLLMLRPFNSLLTPSGKPHPPRVFSCKSIVSRVTALGPGPLPFLTTHFWQH